MSESARPAHAWDLVVDRSDLRHRTVRDARLPDGLEPGQVLMRVDAFALTANNLTYAVTGDEFGYWQLFPAEGDWGRVPAWGTGTVISSTSAEVEVGERFAGMTPMSSHFVMQPRLTRDGIVDLAAHRAAVNPVYNRYARVTGRRDAELERDAALRPVYVLSFVLAHHLRANDWLNSTRLLVTSASSKASLGLAHALRSDQVSVIGLTSAPHRDMVYDTGLFDDVVAYDRLDALSVGQRTAAVDVLGSPAVRDALRQRLGTSLVDTLHVGQTDWDQPDEHRLGAERNAATPFFAPTVIQRLVGERGAADFAERLDAGLRAFTTATGTWLHADHRYGPVAVTGAFDDVAAGTVPPDRFVVVRPTAGSTSSNQLA